MRSVMIGAEFASYPIARAIECFLNSKKPVRQHPAPDRWAAAGPFVAMTAAHPVASRSPDRTGVCRAGRSAPSQCGVVTGPGFSSSNQPDQERTTAYRDSSGSNSQPHAHCATIVGDWEEPSGESRLRTLIRPNEKYRF